LVQIKVKGFKVFSDQDDKAKIKAAVGMAQGGWKMLDKVLPGKPYVSGDLEIRLYKAGGFYTRAVERLVATQISEHVHYVALYGILFADSGTNFPQYRSGMQTTAARARIRRHMGGQVPAWLDGGLSWYANAGASEGKAGKAPKKSIAAAKPAIAGSSSLDLWIKDEVKDLKDGQKVGNERWAWVHYLLHGKGPKDARTAFEKYIATLHLTGDAEAAAAHWDKVDFAKLHQKFKKWGAKWK